MGFQYWHWQVKNSNCGEHNVPFPSQIYVIFPMRENNHIAYTWTKQAFMHTKLFFNTFQLLTST